MNQINLWKLLGPAWAWDHCEARTRLRNAAPGEGMQPHPPWLEQQAPGSGTDLFLEQKVHHASVALGSEPHSPPAATQQRKWHWIT